MSMKLTRLQFGLVEVLMIIAMTLWGAFLWVDLDKLAWSSLLLLMVVEIVLLMKLVGIRRR